MTARRPGEEEPAGGLVRDVLDLIDETVARITEAEVDERLRAFLVRNRKEPWRDEPGQAERG